MSNADENAVQKHLITENISPLKAVGAIKDANGETAPAYYLYPLLDTLIDTGRVAKEIMNNEMKAHFQKKGYVIIEANSREFTDFLTELKRNMLATSGKEFDIKIGTAFMVERVDKTDAQRKVNILIGLVKKQTGDGIEIYLVGHPVDIPETKVPQPSGQRRKDTDAFEPALWYIQKEYPFGYRGMFPHIVSYAPKTQKK